MTIDLGTVLGMLGVAFSFAGFVMKSMLPLRAIALVSNVCFIAYGYVESLLPSLLLNGVGQCRATLGNHQAIQGERASLKTRPSRSGCCPICIMHHRSFKAGEVLFRKGEVADKLIYVAGGQLRLAEIREPVGPGELIGEIGLFSPDKTRTLTLVCETDDEFYYMTDEMIFQLYYQNPKLGFFLVRILVQRLLKDVRRHDVGTATA